MKDASTCSHPLNIAWSDDSLVAAKVLVLERACRVWEDKRHGLKASMRVVGEPSWGSNFEMVEQEEGIKISEFTSSDASTDSGAYTFALF